MNRARILASALSLSMAGFVAILAHEGYTQRAVVPVRGDVPTVGFGSTRREDGSPVQLQDTTDPLRAVQRAAAHLGADERLFRDSIPNVALTQGEYDLYLDFVYQYGLSNWRGSSMREHLRAGRHRQACDALLLWRRQAGRDCSLPANWGPGGCKGVWTRQQARHARCLAEQGR